jgi:hypothetical protein
VRIFFEELIRKNNSALMILHRIGRSICIQNWKLGRYKKMRMACSPDKVVLVPIPTGAPGRDDYSMIIPIVLIRWTSS